MVEEKVYKNFEERQTIIGKMLNVQIPEHYNSFQSFIKQSFKKSQLQTPTTSITSQRAATPKKTKFIHPSSIYTIAFKKSTIYLKMLEKDQKVHEVGYTSDMIAGSTEISRTYYYNEVGYRNWRVKQRI